ncbi:MAG TPA: pitrilysin family protein [Cytophagaceae bacterium]
MEEYDIYTLDNGIRVIHKQVTYTKIAHCGFILDIGSRDETFEQQGIAHFWEHMAFKGTKKRKSYHVINRLEVVGGELNAYTTKEKICFYASILDNHYDKALELLTDITFNSIFPEKEIEKERSVILEEMSMYYDTPEDSIQDEFEQLVFENHALGYNILGTADSVKSFSKQDFLNFISENLDTEKIVFSSIGNIPFSKVKKLCDKYLKDIPRKRSVKKRALFKGYKAKEVSKHRAISQAHCVIGRTTYGLLDKKRLPFFMLINLLGGPGMNSRLNMALRERHGFVYNVEAQYTPFIDTGLLSIYFGTEPGQLNKSLQVALKEIKKIKEVPLGSMQLHLCKEQLIGQLAMAEESNISFMQMMGKSLLDQGQIDSLNDIFDRIKKITSKELQEIANEVFQDKELSFLTYIPE